jgi:hypothetical protein
VDTFIPNQRPVKRAGAPGARVGGIPFGFPVEKWPRCTRCKAPMALFLQLPHHEIYAPLDGKMLFVFQCSDLDRQGCSEYLTGSACFLLGEDELTGCATLQPPCDGESPDGWSLEGWSRADDLIDDDVEGDPHPRFGTKFGGAPGWIQGEPRPGVFDGWRFLCQIDTDGNFDGWIGIQNSGIAYVLVRANEARLVWQRG